MRQVISTDKSPAAIGPYSQAVSAGGLLFCSGQIPLNPEDGKRVGDGDVEAETRQVMKNLSAVLEAGGCTFADVVKTTIFLADMGDFAKVNALYAEHFAENPPARATVQVAGLPLGVQVEIDAIATIPSNS